MKWVIGVAGSGLLAGVLYASNAFAPGAVYDKSFDQAYAELSTMPLLPPIGPAGEGAATMNRAAGSIDWRLAIGTTEVGRFTARLSPVGANRTRVVVEFASASTAPGNDPILSSELMTNFARLSMVEQVDARLENRPPDVREIQEAAARHIQANPAQLEAFGGAVGAQFRNVDSMLQADQGAATIAAIKDLQARHAPPPNPQDATRPSVVFPEN